MALLLTGKGLTVVSVQAMNDWAVQQSSGAAQEFHHRPFPTSPSQPEAGQTEASQTHTPSTASFQPAIWVHRVTRPALVLGSTQDESVLLAEKARSAGYEISTRRSGGGLVLVSPTESCWIDVLLPSNHPYWEDDVSLAFHWVGELWAEALEELGIHGCQVHRGPLLNRELGRVLCFAGLGPGEVTLEGRKIVGLSQRRVRSGARFQGLLVGTGETATLQRFLQPTALPQGTDLEQVLIGHPALAPAIIDALPATLLSLLRNRH